MARLTDIAAEIKTILQGITKTNGYSYDWGSVNQPDQALVTYPCADITYSEEKPDTSIPAAYGYDECTFKVKIKCALSTTTDVPIHAIDAEYDKIMSDVKKVFRANYGYLALSKNAVIAYQGFTKDISKSGDVFVPGDVIATFTVKYQSTET